MKEHAFRLVKGDDLRGKIEQYATDNNIQAGVILSAVGCLDKANIRDASGVKCHILDKRLEICAITGTISVNDSHIHIVVSDDKLITYGGHLKNGCIVNTTVEVVILELSNYSFLRELDEKTGYEEIVIVKK